MDLTSFVHNWLERLEGAQAHVDEPMADHDASGVRGGVLERTSPLRVQVPPCLALLCAAGEDAVCAWIPSGVLEDARRQSDCLEAKERHPVRAQTKALALLRDKHARQKQAFGLFREASIIAKAGERVARWLNETRGSELRKAKSTESALRSLAHVSVVWTVSPHADADLARQSKWRPPTKCKICVCAPCACVTIRLPVPHNFNLGHLIGAHGRFLQPLLQQYPRARVAWATGQGGVEEEAVSYLCEGFGDDDDFVDITGSQDDASAVSQGLRRRCRSILNWPLGWTWRDSRANYPCRRERVSLEDITEGMKEQKEQRERERELDLRKKARKAACASARKKRATASRRQRGGAHIRKPQSSRRSCQGRKGQVLSWLWCASDDD